MGGWRHSSPLQRSPTGVTGKTKRARVTDEMRLDSDSGTLSHVKKIFSRRVSSSERLKEKVPFR